MTNYEIHYATCRVGHSYKHIFNTSDNYGVCLGIISLKIC